jgi:uncharacterized protein (TIGR01777 family)
MRVLVSGASGFIGAELRKKLEARGDSVVPVVRRQPGPGELGMDLSARSLDASKLPEALEGFDAVVHLAGAPIFSRWSHKRREEIMASRVTAGNLLARKLSSASSPPSVFVTGSAIGYYGDRGDELLDETAGPGTGFLADVCRAWEEAARPAAEAGLRVVAVRTGLVLGNGGTLKAQLPIFKAGLGGRLGSGRQWMSFISLEDEVRVLMRAMDDETVAGPLNAVSKEPVRNRDFTAELARALRRPGALFVPAPLLRLGLGRQLADELILTSQRVHPGVLERVGFSFTHPDLDSALSYALAGAAFTADRPAA